MVYLIKMGGFSVAMLNYQRVCHLCEMQDHTKVFLSELCALYFFKSWCLARCLRNAPQIEVAAGWDTIFLALEVVSHHISSSEIPWENCYLMNQTTFQHFKWHKSAIWDALWWWPLQDLARLVQVLQGSPVLAMGKILRVNRENQESSTFKDTLVILYCIPGKAFGKLFVSSNNVWASFSTHFFNTYQFHQWCSLKFPSNFQLGSANVAQAEVRRIQSGSWPHGLQPRWSRCLGDRTIFQPLKWLILTFRVELKIGGMVDGIVFFGLTLVGYNMS
jgi:hypothetical protein